VAGVADAGLTYLDVAALTSLFRLTRALDVSGIPGSIVEAGCAEGGSAIVIASAKHPDRPMSVHDVFGMIPEPGPQDGDDVHARYATIAEGRAEGVGGRQYYGYRADLLEEVAGNFARFNVPLDTINTTLVRGLFQDTVYPDGPVALAHIDGDWYESVSVCLERILPMLSPGGVIVVDDYFAWSGCFHAVRDACRDLGPDFAVVRWREPRLWITRRAA
jgi:asparagine synthase (glutamine-hydrolysing)